MEAAEEKQKIRQEILSKGRVVAISEVVQVRVTLFGLDASERVRKGMSYSVDTCLCITRRRGQQAYKATKQAFQS